jgi:hypothetical protein
LTEERPKRVKGEARRDAEIEQRAAIVLRAPSGMSRALQNKSKWDNRHKCLLWTVEWVLEDGSKVLGNCQETRTISEAFANAVGKRRMKAQQSFANRPTHSAQDTDSQPVSEIRNPSASSSAPPPETNSSTEHHFYLHRPNLPSDIKCLVPLQPATLIRKAIQDRVLIEFPTIFVLGASKHGLQKPFVTEEDYLHEHGKRPPVIASDAPHRGLVLNDNDQDSVVRRKLPERDEKMIEEVLQKSTT